MKEKKKKKVHHHHHHHPVKEKNLLLATLLNLVITVVEIAGGILSGSLALLSDALHNLSDTIATFIAYLAILIGKREANQKNTFGFKRAEILAALINAVTLIVTSFFLLREAWERWQNPEPINSLIMLTVAMIGLLANLYAVVILRKDSGKSMNVRAAYIHLIGDSLSSVLVILGGLAIQFFEAYWIDPLITLLISIYLIRSGYLLLRQAVHILMQSSPEHLNLEAVKKTVENVEYIANIHHMHAWMLTDHAVHMEAHLELTEDLKMSEVGDIQKEIESLLKEEFDISHVTLQCEYKPNHATGLIHR